MILSIVLVHIPVYVCIIRALHSVYVEWHCARIIEEYLSDVIN